LRGDSGPVAAAEASCDGRRGRVGEEDAQADDRDEDGRRERETGERRGPEVTHDRRVDQDEQGFGDEGAQRRDGEGQYLPVHAGGCVSDR